MGGRGTGRGGASGGNQSAKAAPPVGGGRAAKVAIAQLSTISSLEGSFGESAWTNPRLLFLGTPRGTKPSGRRRRLHNGDGEGVPTRCEHWAREGVFVRGSFANPRSTQGFRPSFT